MFKGGCFMEKLTQEEMARASAMAREKWPESFSGEYNGRPNFQSGEIDAFNTSLRQKQAARTAGLPIPFRPKF
jgi:hypothetical protein